MGHEDIEVLRQYLDLVDQDTAGAHLRFGAVDNIPGGTPALYNADAVLVNQPVALVEGEIDALTIAQLASDVATTVATGSTTGARRAKYCAVECPPIHPMRTGAAGGAVTSVEYCLGRYSPRVSTEVGITQTLKL